jgi:hypothetical protein
MEDSEMLRFCIISMKTRRGRWELGMADHATCFIFYKFLYFKPFLNKIDNCT